MCYVVYGIMLWWFKRPDDSDAKVYGLVLTVLGGALSCATIFLNSETYQLFRRVLHRFYEMPRVHIECCNSGP